MAFAVESHSWHKHKVNLGISPKGEIFACGFEDVEGTRLQTAVVLIAPQHQIIANHHRQKQLTLVAKERLQVGLVGQGMIEENGLSRLPLGRLTDGLTNLQRPLGKAFAVSRLLPTYLLTQFLFGHQ